MKDEPTIEEELDVPTQIGRCINCGYKVMSDTDYVPLEDRSFMCAKCVDKTIAEIAVTTTESGRVTRHSRPSFLA